MYFKFKKPKPVDIIIFDSTCDYLFSDNMIDHKLSYSIVESKHEIINNHINSVLNMKSYVN